MANLLLHSLSELDEIVLGLVDRCSPRAILEIGSEHGGFSQQLHDRCAKAGTKLHTVEPFPAPAVVELAKTSETLELYVDKSIPHLLQRGCGADFVVVDGDHNWFTVYNELTLIARSWEEKEMTGTIVLHDVSWPCARRDQYYDPADIPAEALHPYCYQQGVTVGVDEMVDGGFRGEGAFAYAVKAGGPCNGVLTAIEDFVADNPGWTYRSIDAVFGLGCLTRAGTREDAIAAEVFAPYQNSLVGRLEANRLALYLKVIELQDALKKVAA
ncbi:MAG: class I SAM-dependent methyltransferase [Labilithrix sp.]|nr:class I SAM-dependent methyltransferase [Labilithrix sp.]MCW5817180.1 class I SAM-dependent methyltransferase [Labilithrix sp.]